MIDIKDKLTRPAYVMCEILRDGTIYGRKGDRVQFSAAKAEMLCESNYVRLCETEGVSNKAVESAAPKRGPGRPPKIRPDNKAIGA